MFLLFPLSDFENVIFMRILVIFLLLKCTYDNNYIYIYIYIYIYNIYIYICPVGVTSLYRVLNYKAINK